MSLFDLFDWVKYLIEVLGYGGVFVGTFLESVFPPIPSEVIMGFSGFLISESKFQWIPTILAAAAGNALSVSLIWFLGHKYGRDFLIRWGKYIGVSQQEIEKGEKLFQKYGYGVVLGCQMVPLARSWVAFPAGVLKTKYPIFIFFNTLGATIWLTVLCYLGFIAGENWDTVEETLKPFENAILGIFALIVIFLAYRFYLNKKKLSSEN